MAHGNRYHSFSTITPSDTVDNPFDAIYVGTTGNIAVVPESGPVVVFTSVPVGILYVAGRRVNATSTTATNLKALRG